jgi:hypothetical protein
MTEESLVMVTERLATGLSFSEQAPSSNERTK